MNAYQKAAAWAVVQAMFAGCSAGGPFDGERKPASPPPPTAPTPAAPAPTVTSPSITAQPVSVSVLTGATATFTVTATGSSPTYQWKKNDVAISGATSASYTTPAASYLDAEAAYTVVVSNSAGTAKSTPATLHLTLSADQAAFESFALAPNGIYETSWELNYAGGQTSGTDWLDYDYAVLGKSPLTNGPQTGAQQAPVNMTTSLALPTGGVTRILKNGVVLVVPDLQATYTTSYLGSAIQIDYLASDNKTVAYSKKRYNYATSTLSGPLHSAPSELKNPYNSIFANPGVLNTTTTWAPGSAYLKFTASALGDRYVVFDCGTGGNSPQPCQTGTTLSAAMSAGETSSHDATTYHTADGKMSNIGGVNIWVASQPRPISSVGAYTVEYRIYFEMNGNVYTGTMIKDGTVEGSLHYRTNPSDSTTTTYLDYQVRLNAPAMQSLAAGSQL